ncbi:hypothetical protein ACFWGL_17190 [Streptomyces sp. NPDC060286]|uniref:hypothetical protein n=1 Tax=unclassified Streptomyces TaxID=2593676 RepID=UPI0035E339CD
MTDGEYELLAAAFSGDGVYGTPRDTPVVTAGVGLTVAIRANVVASLRGHAWTSGTTGDSLPIAPNSSGQTRTDRVVLRLDRTTWTVRAVVSQGTPGAGLPPLAQSTAATGVYEIPLAEVSVAKGATAVTVQRRELYVGTRIRAVLSDALPPNPARGDLVYEVDTVVLSVWNGASWQPVWEPRRAVSIDAALSGWSIGTQSVLEAKAGTVHLRLGSWTRTAGRLDGSTQSRMPVLIPAAYRHPVRDQYVTGYVSGLQVCRLTIGSAASDRPGQVWLTQHPDIPTGASVLTSGISWVVN